MDILLTLTFNLSHQGRGDLEANMKIEYDREVDTLYIRVQEKKVAHTREIEEGINLIFEETNQKL